MNICAACFSDKELKSFISSSRRIGDCDCCASKHESLMDLPELLDFFQELLQNFRVCDKGMPLSKKIQSDWSFFSSHSNANKILSLVLPDLLTDVISPAINVDYTEDIIENYNHWEMLKEELKWNNRFIVNLGRLEDLGWDGFFDTQFKLTKDIELYRGRLHHQSGRKIYGPEEMSCPPKENATGGRANPLGIPFLYLCDNLQTVLYEVRASYLDELTIGTFQLNASTDSAVIVDFTEDTSLFQSNSSSINKIIKGKLLRDLISQDLSKPMRRYDSELEYIPTQFICEFIKVYTGACGIRFKSSLHPSGNNIVMFDKNLMICKSVQKRKVSSIRITDIHMD
jgi:hypothetical protein